MDFDGDGILDLVSGSYDPGELYLFRGLGQGRFAAREVIRDRSGKPILKVPTQKDRVESFGSWMTLVDWDDDGDLDILVGTFDGMMFLRRNEGTRPRPIYSTQNEWVMVGNKRLCVPGGAHANPVIADWDGDGLWDIVTGSADGGVYWYRNIGRKGKPEFGPPVALVPPHEGSGYGELLLPDASPRPGIRSQIAVADYDGDGKLDLLVGDFCTYLQIRRDLTNPERKRVNQLVASRDANATRLGAKMEDLRAQFAKAMTGVPPSDWHTPENNARWQKMYKQMRESPEYDRLYKAYESANKDLEKFVERPPAGASIGNDPSTAHGYVWLFRRK